MDFLTLDPEPGYSTADAEINVPFVDDSFACFFCYQESPGEQAPKFCLPSRVRSTHPFHNPAFNTTIFCLNSPYTPRVPVVLSTLYSSCSCLLYNNNSNAPSAYKDISIRISSFHLSLSLSFTHIKKTTPHVSTHSIFQLPPPPHLAPPPPPPHNLPPPTSPTPTPLAPTQADD